VVTAYPAHAIEGVVMCKEYNGWANWETWNVGLWIGEVDGLPDMIFEQAKKEVEEQFNDDEFDKWTATRSLAKYLEELCHEVFDTEDSTPAQGPLADAIGMYYAQVQWHDIAENYIDEAVQELGINPSAIVV